MRALIWMATISLFTPVFAGAAGSTPALPSGFDCFEHLATPEYPKTALEDHVDGSVWLWAHLSQQATVEKIDTQVVSAWGNGSKLLTPPAEQAIHSSKFKASCAGKTVPVVFRFELHGEPVPSPKVTSRTEAPDVMYIESEPEGTVSAKNTKS